MRKKKDKSKRRFIFGIMGKITIGIVLSTVVITFLTTGAMIGIVQGISTIIYWDNADNAADMVATQADQGELFVLRDAVLAHHSGEMTDEELDEIAGSDACLQIYDTLESVRGAFGATYIRLCLTDDATLMNYDAEADSAGTWKPLITMMDCQWDEATELPAGTTFRYPVEDGTENEEAYSSFVTMVNGGGELPSDEYNTSIGDVRENCEVTVFIPYAIDGAIQYYLEISIGMDNIAAYIKVYLKLLAWWAVITASVVLAITLIYIWFKMIRPLRLIRREAGAFVSADPHVSEKLVKVHTHDEIQDVAESVQTMQQDILRYMNDLVEAKAAEQKIAAELDVAAQIQEDMLPREFPAFPNRKEFDIYALMDPAKEVGGDFYDFFFIDQTHLAMVMADVSGKGIPASLFMSIAKALIKTHAQQGGTPAQILKRVNEQLCEGNDAEQFVTVWLAIVDVTTGIGIETNAGHEHPIVRHAGGAYETEIYRHSLPVAAIETVKFRDREFELHPGDRIVVYTDGAPEATNIHDELYGCERMLDVLNRRGECTAREALEALKADIDAFTGEAPQFDDVTILVFDFFGVPEDKEVE